MRWAAIGAAVAVAVGGGGLLTASASVGSGARNVFVPITPCRLFDTRGGADNVGPRSTPLGARESFVTAVRGANGRCTIPDDALGVSMNLSIVGPTAASFLTVYPADQALPLASNLNFVGGQAPTGNGVNATLSADGKLAVYNYAGSVDVIVDLLGYYVDHTHDDRYLTRDQTYSRDQLVTPDNQIGVLGRLTRTQVAAGAWDADPARDVAIDVGTTPFGIAFDGSDIWVSDYGSNDVKRIDRNTNAVTATLTGFSTPIDVQFDGRYVWVANNGAGTVSRIDPTDNSKVSFAAGPAPYGITFAAGSVWVSNDAAQGTVTRLDQATGAIQATIPVSAHPHDLRYALGRVFVTAYSDGNLRSIDPATNTSSLTGSGGTSGLTSLAWDGATLWYAYYRSGGAGRFGFAYASGGGGGTDALNDVTGMAFDGAQLWISRYDQNTIVRRMPYRGFSLATYEVRADVFHPRGIVFDGTDIWVAGSGNDKVHRLRV